MDGLFFSMLGLKGDKKDLKIVSEKLNISTERLIYLNKKNKLPDENELKKIQEVFGISSLEIMLGMGVFDHSVTELLRTHRKKITAQLGEEFEQSKAYESSSVKNVFSTNLGTLYQGDCISLLKNLESNSVNMVFADPPFNLDKYYASEMDDDLPEHKYLSWCESWISECIRILKDGGSFFLWNIPKWHIILSKYLDDRLTFRNWIATDIKFSLPIQGKLYPSHYSLLYFVKGEKPNAFNPDRLPMEVCRNCFRELKDYGGYKNKMNPSGINLTDVWFDIPPVRHNKYKKRKEANELSIKLLDRIIQMSTNEDDIIFDPFGGSGTTYIVAELKKRKWIGVELGPTNGIVERFTNIEAEQKYLNSIRGDYNRLFSKEVKEQRVKKGIWVEETFNHDLFSI
jgi:site-specific DNA-methyltransferase (adenine-specific)